MIDAGRPATMSCSPGIVWRFSGLLELSAASKDAFGRNHSLSLETGDELNQTMILRVAEVFQKFPN